MSEKIYRILSINPGSTSTRIGLYENETKIIEDYCFHDSSILSQFHTINDQLDYRMEVLEEFLVDQKIDMSTIDAIVGRGGSSYSVESGTYTITEKLVEDTRACKGGLYHASMLGTQMAYRLHQKYGGGICIMINPTVVDEYDDIARVTGVKGVYRISAMHALNIKEVARRYSNDIGKPYESLRLIVAHIDGGISMAVHKYGRMVDGIDGGGGEGPFTPVRMGGMAISDFNNHLRDLSFDEVRELLSVKGGLSNYFGTSNSAHIHQMVEEGNEEAVRVWHAMGYQCAKSIGSLATVLEGQVDAIVLTGDLCKYDDLMDTIRKGCGWIAPIVIYPGEYEHDAMTAAALRVLRGEEEPKTYTGIPVFQGFKEDK